MAPLLPRPLRNSRGQSVVEFAILLPFLLLIAFGMSEMGYVLLDQHVVSKLTREGSNLISRNTTLADARAALSTMSARPVDFSTRSKMILSVLKRGATSGTGNYDKVFLYQRHEYGALGYSSKLATRGGGSFAGAPNYEATNSDTATGLQVTNVPSDLIVVKGGMVYVTEIYTTHQLLTPLGQWGVVNVPTTLYSIAYF